MAIFDREQYGGAVHVALRPSPPSTRVAFIAHKPPKQKPSSRSNSPTDSRPLKKRQRLLRVESEHVADRTVLEAEAEITRNCLKNVMHCTGAGDAIGGRWINQDSEQSLRVPTAPPKFDQPVRNSERRLEAVANKSVLEIDHFSEQQSLKRFDDECLVTIETLGSGNDETMGIKPSESSRPPIFLCLRVRAPEASQPETEIDLEALTYYPPEESTYGHEGQPCARSPIYKKRRSICRRVVEEDEEEEAEEEVVDVVGGIALESLVNVGT